MRRRRLTSGLALMAAGALPVGALPVGVLPAGVLLVGCAPQPERHAAALTLTEAATARRSRQSRRFDTGDQVLMLQAATGVLQDLGYTIAESQAQFGLLVGTKATPRLIRAQISVRPDPDGRTSTARVIFQVAAPGLMGEQVLDDPPLYAQFFDRLSQSLFLTAHAI